MRKFLLIATLFSTIFISCKTRDTKDYKFGTKFNPARKGKGSPLVKHNMVSKFCCSEETVFEIDNIPTDTIAYHFAKAISAVTDGYLTNEKDIYRKNLDDTTLLQLNILTIWDPAKDKVRFTSNLGKIDRRSLNLKAKEFVNQNSNYPDYEWFHLTPIQVDSVLLSWNLSRFDPE